MKKLLIVLISCVLLFCACKVGLGETVDILPPELSVNYPSPNEKVIIKDSFIMSGTVSDDFAVESVEIRFNGKESGIQYAYGPYNATIDVVNGTWDIADLNKKVGNEYPIKDAKYTVTVTAIDASGQKTSITVDYEIDNTAPVVVMQNPGSDDVLRPEEFGTSIKISGKAADPNINKILFTVYEKNTGAYSQLGQKEIILSGNQSINTTIGEYSANDVNEFYNVIYGSSTGEKELFYSIQSFDTAKEYKGTANNNTIGNSSLEYYLFEDVSAQNITAEILYTMKNGSFYANKSNGSIDTVLQSTATNAIQQTQINVKNEADVSLIPAPTLAVFTIQPSSHPTFELVGIPSITGVSDGNLPDANGINSSTMISVKLIPNRDGVPVDPNKVTIIAKKLKENVNEANSFSTIYQLYPLENVVVTPTLSDGTYTLTLSQKGSVISSIPTDQSSSKAVSGQVMLPYGSYILDVIGVDTALNDDNTPKTDNGLPKDGSNNLVGNYDNGTDVIGFQRLSTNTPPRVEVTSVASKNIVEGEVSFAKIDDTSSISVIANVESFADNADHKIQSITYILKKGSTVLKTETFDPFDAELCSEGSDNSEYTLEFDLNHDNFGKPSTTDTYSLEITAKDSANKTSELSKTMVLYDVVDPVISNADIRHTVKLNPDGTKKVEMQVSTSDDIEVASVQYEITTTVTADPITATTPGNFTFNFDTYSSASVEFTIIDHVGNKTTKTFVLDSTVPTLSNEKIKNPASPDWNGINNNEVWYKSKVLDISVTAIDKAPTGANVSGIQSVEYTTVSNPTEQDWFPLTIDQNDTWTGKIMFAGSDTYNISFRALDGSKNSTELNNALKVIIDCDAPSKAQTALGSTVLTKGSDVTIPLTALTDNESGFKKVQLKSIGSKNYTEDLTVSDGKVTITASQLALTAGGSVIVTTFDNVGNKTDSTLFSLVKDAIAPTITILSPSSSERTGVNGNLDIVLDVQDQNGIENVVIKKQNDTNWSVTDDDGSDGWSFKINTNDGTFGTSQIFTILATDKAGNEATETLALTIDQNADIPLITLFNVDVTGMDTSNPAKLSETQIRGTVVDDDGVKKLEIKNGASYTEVTVQSDGSWIYPETGALDNGESIIGFRVTDTNDAVFENSKITGTASTNLTVAVDTEAPTIKKIEISFDNGTTWKTFQDNELLGGVKKDFVVRISAQDTNKVDSFTIVHRGTELVSKNDFTITGDDTNKVAVSRIIDSSTLENGYQRLTLNVYDAAGGLGTDTKQTIIDNKAPIITDITSHEYDAQVTGTVELQASISGGNPGATIESVYYAIPEKSGTSWVKPAETSPLWKKVNTGAVGFSITFDGVNEPTLTSFATTNGIENDGGGLWYVPVVFKLTDSLGQVHITDVPSNKADTETVNEDHFKFRVDPNGDKPSVEVAYPLQNGADPTVLGGTIGIFGSAKDNEAIDAVYMQIDSDGDGNYDDDKLSLQSHYTITDINPTPKPEGSDPNAWWGIKVTGKNSWNFKINESNEFNDSIIKYRVRSVDIDGAVSEWSNPIAIKVDADVPTIGESHQLMLVQYDNSNTIVKQQKYVDDMWISGLWYLTGSIEDTTGIASIDVEGDISGDETSVSASEKWFIKNTGSFTNGKYGYTMNIPLGLDSSNVSFSISATKQTSSNPPTTQRMISINRDNTAPSATEVLKNRDLPIDNTNKVQQSNAMYTFGSEVTEAGGGLSHIAFWFERDVPGNTNDRIYNPMEDRANGANKTTLQRGTIASGDVGMINNLPRLHLEGVTRGSESTLTHSSIIDNKNVRIGGLVSIAGVDRLIDGVDYSTGTVSFSPSVATSYTTADIAYVMVVDNQGVIETKRDNGTISNDDGDGMLEYIEKAGNDYTWTASIDSRNIPDGPIEIHFVVYDKSGNVSTGPISISTVSNNAPTIAKIELGTDLNGNDSIESAETRSYSTLDGLGNEVNNAIVDGSATFTAKGLTHITPTIVGGNGNIYFSVGTAIPNANTTLLRTGENGDIDPIVVTLSNDTIVNNVAGDPAVFNYILWDSTEESIVGTNSQTATLSVKMHVDVVDDIAPTTTIKPFYWNSEGDNSLYGNSRENGHIELPAHLPVAFTDGGSGINDRDPKVSGKITFTGTVSDNKTLSEIWVRIGGFTFTNTLTGGTAPTNNMVKIAEFNADTGNWITSTSSIDNNGFLFSIIDNNLGQSGHTVTWQLDWDSSYITKHAGKNKTLLVASKDTAGKASSIVRYQIDIVPYVSNVSTEIGRKKSTNARTALGNYVVKSGETGVVLEGFNLATETDITVPTNSGEYTVMVNGISSFNNINNNEAPYNKTIGIANNDTLIDDVYFDVWGTSVVANRSSADLESPEMKINPTDGKIGYAFVNDYSFNMPEVNGAGNITKQHNASGKGVGPYFESALAFNPNGNVFCVSGNQDKNVGVGEFVYIFSNNTGSRKNFLGTGINADNIKVKRVYTPSLAATNSGVYLAYFDVITKQLRYHYGTLDNGYINGGQLNNSVGNTITDAKTKDYSIIAKLENGIDYVSLDARTIGSTDIVVITWYDKSTGILKMAYNNTNPKQDSNKIGASDKGWYIRDIDLGNSGLYNSVKIDAEGGVHIAYHTTSGLDLKYAYLSKDEYIKTEPRADIVTVDAFGATGKNIRLDVAKKDGNLVPYISYYEGGVAKLAYRSDFSTVEIPAGADKDTGKYTGKWEISCVPSSSAVKDDTVCIGVHKSTSDDEHKKIEGANGTMNPVISYVNADGNLEKAQLR